MAQLNAVLTGDLIHSRKAGWQNTNAAISELQNAADTFGGLHGFDPRFTRNRGDGWQILLLQPELAFDALLYLFARLRAARLPLDTRIAIGIGTTETHGTADLSDASGAAFTRSGHALETMRNLQFAITTPEAAEWPRALLRLSEILMKTWSPEQAEVVALKLVQPDLTQQVIADQLGITRQAVQSRLAASDLDALDPARTAFAKAYDKVTAGEHS